MKKYVFYVLFLLATVGMNAQSVGINEAIKNAADYFARRLPEGTIITILNVESDSERLSDYAVNELAYYLIHGGRHTLVSRDLLNTLQLELEIQLGGYIEDATAIGIGHWLGAETIILGKIQPFGNNYRLDFHALSVRTAAIQGIFRQDVLFDQKLADLMRSNARPPSELWKQNRLYFGLRVGGGFFPVNFTAYTTIYTFEEKWVDTNTVRPEQKGEVEGYFGVRGGVVLCWYITEWLGLQPELIYSWYYEKWNSGYLALNSFMLPILAKLTVRPGNFSLSALGGIYFGIPLLSYGEYTVKYISYGKPEEQPYDWNEKPPKDAGFMYGAEIGRRVGPGIFFVSVRHNFDFDGAVDIIDFSLGFAVGAFPRK
jgi:hypothetical protein